MRSDPRHGPLPLLLFALTTLTGLVDSISYLGLGHVFVANMTGNVVFLGFALAGAPDLSITASLIAIAAFMAGAFAGGWLGARLGAHRGKLLAVVTDVKILLVGTCFVAVLLGVSTDSPVGRYLLIVLLAISMGLQNATARRLAVPDMTTTVLTLTLTGLAADSRLAGGKGPNPRRRIAAALLMCAGAGVGAWLLLQFGVRVVLGLGLVLLVVNGIATHRVAASSEEWTRAGG